MRISRRWIDVWKISDNEEIPLWKQDVQENLHQRGISFMSGSDGHSYAVIYGGLTHII